MVFCASENRKKQETRMFEIIRHLNISFTKWFAYLFVQIFDNLCSVWNAWEGFSKLSSDMTSFVVYELSEVLHDFPQQICTLGVLFLFIIIACRCLKNRVFIPNFVRCSNYLCLKIRILSVCGIESHQANLVQICLRLDKCAFTFHEACFWG